MVNKIKLINGFVGFIVFFNLLTSSSKSTVCVSLFLNADLPFGAKKRERNVGFGFKYYIHSAAMVINFCG